METSGKDPEKQIPVEEDEPPTQAQLDGFSLGRRGQMVFFSLAVLALMVALDGTSLSVALPVGFSDVVLAALGAVLTSIQVISRKIGGTAIEAFWAGTSFLLCAAGTSGSVLSRSMITVGQE